MWRFLLRVILCYVAGDYLLLRDEYNLTSLQRRPPRVIILHEAENATSPIYHLYLWNGPQERFCSMNVCMCSGTGALTIRLAPPTFLSSTCTSRCTQSRFRPSISTTRSSCTLLNDAISLLCALCPDSAIFPMPHVYSFQSGCTE